MPAMSHRHLFAASAACFSSAVLGALYLPSFLLTGSRFLQVGIPVVSLGLYGFFMLAFRELLHRTAGFRKADLTILLLIAGFAGLVLSSVLDEISYILVPASLVLVLGCSLLVGLGSVVLGFQLLSIRREMGILMTVFSVLLILQGLFFASVVWIPAGILVAVFSDGVLGFLFLKTVLEDRAEARAV